MISKSILAILFVALFLCATVLAQTTEFSHQGTLNDGGSPANGNYDFEFKLFDTASGGTQVGSTVQRLNVAVANGIYAVSVDFGVAGLTGTDRFLDIAVRATGGASFTPLTPRQKINSTPYSVRSLNAGTAATASGLNCTGCVTAPQIASVNGSAITGTIPVASVPTGSGSYVQNQNASPQASTNFNISGNGTVGGTVSGATVNAMWQFNLNGGRILSNLGADNLFVGASTGAANSGIRNAFFGSLAGQANTIGGHNSFLGTMAGQQNTTGSFNTFVGIEAGQNNTNGSQNTFFGAQAGLVNVTAGANSFFGYGAGFASSAPNNSFFGWRSGTETTTGGSNSFFGASSGELNLAGSSNVFVGERAGRTNTNGSMNTLIGSGADVNSNSLVFATAIGANAIVAESYRIQLGRDSLETVSIGKLAVGTATQLCINGTVLSSCSSSRRYKENILPFESGFSLIKKLQPVTFDWKGQKEQDIGLIAEQVGEVEPLLVTHNTKGEIEGIKYDQLSLVLINAIKEQQTQIERQQVRLYAQQKQIAALLASNTLLSKRVNNIDSRLSKKRVRRR